MKKMEKYRIEGRGAGSPALLDPRSKGAARSHTASNIMISMSRSEDS